MINAYDFDKTIYDGDCTIDFYLFCLKKNKMIIFLLPIQFYGFILYKFKIKEKEYFKEKFFIFLKTFDDIDNIIEEFCDKNFYKIKNWYLNQKKGTDLIISASPYFLIKKMCDKLKIENVIASNVDKKTGEFLSKNCYGKEKVIRFKQKFKNKRIKNFYSDSMSDKPMMQLANNAYLVKKNNITKLSDIE